MIVVGVPVLVDKGPNEATYYLEGILAFEIALIMLLVIFQKILCLNVIFNFLCLDIFLFNIVLEWHFKIPGFKRSHWQ